MASEREIEAAAKAMFIFRCESADPETVCREVWGMAQHRPTVTFYRENARIALTAAEQSRAQVEEQWKMVPVVPTAHWVHNLANQRQGQSREPRYEPPGPFELERARCDIQQVLAASPPPPASQVTEDWPFKALEVARRYWDASFALSEAQNSARKELLDDGTLSEHEHKEAQRALVKAEDERLEAEAGLSIFSNETGYPMSADDLRAILSRFTKGEK